MNTHLATYPTPNGALSALWLTGQPSPVDELAYRELGTPLPHSQKLELTFRRTALGFCFDPLYALVIGERAFTRGDTTTTIYVALDEAIDTDIPADAWKCAIDLKDRYRVSRAFCPSEPDQTVSMLRRLEGFSHYPAPRIEAAARTRWPFFSDFDLTCGLVPRELPPESTLTARVNELLTETATDPRTGSELIGSDGHSIPRILFLDDFPVHRTIQSVRTNALGGITALWLAIDGLQRTAHRVRTEADLEREQAFFERGPNRNPAGY